MANRLTRNLRLRIENGLSAASVYNLERLDLLGASVYVTTSDDVVIRATEDIILQPSSDDIGGSSDGGAIYLGQSGNSVDEVYVYATEFYVNDELMPAPSDILTTSDLDGKEDYLGIPTVNGQVLKGDTNGDRYWGTLSGVVASQNEAITWAVADGLSKTIVHGYGADFVEVQVYDPTVAGYIGIESITYIDNDTVQLEVLEAPSNDWKVFIREIVG